MRHFFRSSVLAIALTCAASESVHSQTIYPADLDGETVNLVVPTDFCALDTERPSERQIFRTLQSILGKGSRLLLAYFECNALELFRDNPGASPRLNRRGLYYFQVDDRGTALIFENQKRAEFVELIASKFPAFDVEAALEDAVARTKEVLKDPAAEATIEYFGLNGFSKDAAYFSAAGVETNLGDTYPILVSSATTLVRDRMVTLTRSDATDNADAIKELDRVVRTLLAEFLAANPDSDN
jgi:hypothetical protein